jgi:hypothetical protein
MLSHRSHRRGASLRALALILTSALAVGLIGLACSDNKDETAPEPELNVMGVIMMDRVQPEGGPYQVGVVVTIDGVMNQDATVLINDEPITFREDPDHPELTGYTAWSPTLPRDHAHVTSAGQPHAHGHRRFV